jgi:hypothetical protein
MAGIAVLRPTRDLGFRGKGILRIPMTSQTIAHPHGHGLIYNVHRLHFAVTRLAENSGAYVRPVIKINVIRQGVNSQPLHRRSRGIHGGDPLDIRAFRPGDSVAVHALFDIRDARLPRLQGAAMAIKAGDFHNPGVQFVGVGDGLPGLIESSQPVRFGKPSDTQHRNQNDHCTGR